MKLYGKYDIIFKYKVKRYEA